MAKGELTNASKGQELALSDKGEGSIAKTLHDFLSPDLYAEVTLSDSRTNVL